MNANRGPFAPFSAARQLRNRWFADLSHATEGYMRSAQFLEWMRYVLAALNGVYALQTRTMASLLSMWKPGGPWVFTHSDKPDLGRRD